MKNQVTFYLHSVVSDSVPMHRYKYVVSPERIYGGMLPNGSWNGLMGVLLNEVSDAKAVIKLNLSSIT